MVNSVNTNIGATVALQSLNKTNTELDKVQKQVSTGYKVADAKDDGAAFAVAQGLRGKVKGNEAVNERLSVAKGLLSVTQEGLKGISDTTGDIRKTLVKLADANLSGAERTQYNADYTALTADITKYIGRGDVNVIYTRNGSVYSLIASHNLDVGSNIRGNLTFSWSYPIKGNLKGYLQASHGYGETLIDYNYRQTTVGIGISLVEWL